MRPWKATHPGMHSQDWLDLIGVKQTNTKLITQIWAGGEVGTNLGEAIESEYVQNKLCKNLKKKNR